MTTEQLLQHAVKARDNALAPFSRFKVVAALLTSGGKLYTGCNIENATHGLAVCAARMALGKALTEGERAFTQIALAPPFQARGEKCGHGRLILRLPPWAWGCASRRLKR